MSRSMSSSSATHLRRSDSFHSVSSGSGRSDDSRGSPNATSQTKGKSVSFNKNVRVQYPRRTSHSFSKFDSLSSLNGRHSPVTKGNYEIDYSNTNLNGGGTPFATSPHHPGTLSTVTSGSPPIYNNIKPGGGKKFWSSVWRSQSTRRPEDIIKYKVKHSSPLLGKKLSKKQLGSESPQVKRNHVKKIVNIFNRQAAVEKQKLKETQDTLGPKKGLHDFHSTMPIPATTLSRTASGSSSPPLRPSTSPPAPPTSLTSHFKMPTLIKRTTTTTTYEPKSYDLPSFSSPLSYQTTDSSVNTSDKENNSMQSGSSFLNRDSGISLPSSPIRLPSPGPYISTVTLNHSPRDDFKDYRHEFRSIPPFESSDDSACSDGSPPQRPSRNKISPTSGLTNGSYGPPMAMPPMKDAAVQVKPGNLTPVEELPPRFYAPLYSQVNKALKKTQFENPPPPPPPPSQAVPSKWSSALTSPYLIPPPSKWASDQNRSLSPNWKNSQSISPTTRLTRTSSPYNNVNGRYSDSNQHSDFMSDGESGASRSRTPISHVKTSGRSFGFNIGTKKKVKNKKTKSAQESDSSSSSSQGVGRSQSLLRNTAPVRSPDRSSSRSQHYNSMLDLSPAYNRSRYPTYEEEYGSQAKSPHTFSWTLSLGRNPKSKRSVDGGSTATGPIYSSQAPVSQAPRRAYSDAPSSVDEDHPPYTRRGGLSAAFHARNQKAEAYPSAASSCGSMAASEAAGVREPIVMYIPGVQRTKPEALNRSNSFLNQDNSTLNRKEHKSRFAKQEAKNGKTERYKPKDKEKINQQVHRSQSIPRNARLL